jgi:hypothetical protein
MKVDAHLALLESTVLGPAFHPKMAIARRGGVVSAAMWMPRLRAASVNLGPTALRAPALHLHVMPANTAAGRCLLRCLANAMLGSSALAVRLFQTLMGMMQPAGHVQSGITALPAPRSRLLATTVSL